MFPTVVAPHENGDFDNQTPKHVDFQFHDLMRGEGEWQNIQEIIRSTFQNLTQQLHQQQQHNQHLFHQIQKLQQQQDKSKLGLDRALSCRFTNAIEYDQLISTIDTKLDQQTFLLSKQQQDQRFQELSSQLTLYNKPSKELLKTLSHVSKRMDSLEDELQTIVQVLDRHPTIEVLNQCLELKANKKSVAAALHEKVKVKEYEKQMKKLNKRICKHERVLAQLDLLPSTLEEEIDEKEKGIDFYQSAHEEGIRKGIRAHLSNQLKKMKQLEKHQTQIFQQLKDLEKDSSASTSATVITDIQAQWKTFESEITQLHFFKQTCTKELENMKKKLATYKTRLSSTAESLQNLRTTASDALKTATSAQTQASIAETKAIEAHSILTTKPISIQPPVIAPPPPAQPPTPSNEKEFHNLRHEIFRLNQNQTQLYQTLQEDLQHLQHQYYQQQRTVSETDASTRQEKINQLRQEQVQLSSKLLNKM